MSAVTDPASLENLHDIVVPDVIGFWPPAPGWVGVATVLGAVVAVWAWRRYRRYRREAYRRRALVELRSLDADSIDRLPVLLKSAALAAFPRERVAALSGPAWWQLLDHSAGITHFTQGQGLLLDALAYRNAASTLNVAQRRALLESAALWLRRHRVEGS